MVDSGTTRAGLPGIFRKKITTIFMNVKSKLIFFNLTHLLLQLMLMIFFPHDLLYIYECLFGNLSCPSHSNTIVKSKPKFIIMKIEINYTLISQK